MSFTIPVELTTKQIADLVVTAVEGGINYWCSDFLPDEVTGEVNPWYSDPKFYERDFKIELVDAEDGGEIHILTAAKMRENLTKLPPNTIADIVQDNADAETADVFVQVCVFGEIVYS